MINITTYRSELGCLERAQSLPGTTLARFNDEILWWTEWWWWGIMKIFDKQTRVSDDIILIMKHLDGIYGSELHDNDDVAMMTIMMIMMIMTIMMIRMISDKQTQQEAVEASLHNKTLIVSTILVSSHHCHRNHHHDFHHHKHHYHPNHHLFSTILVSSHHCHRHHRHHHKHHHHQHHHDHLYYHYCKIFPSKLFLNSEHYLSQYSFLWSSEQPL